MSSNVILFGGCALALLYLHARNLVGRLAYKIGGVSLVSIGREEVKLNVTLYVNNPTSIRAQVGNFIANLYINGQYVGKVDYPVNRYLNPGVNNFIVGVTLNPTMVGSVLWTQLQSGNLYNMSMDIDGAIDIDSKQLKIKTHLILEDFINVGGK